MRPRGGEEYGDELPRTYDELVALPGIGDYTASAVLSFAFGERIAVIDTNIRRVLSRRISRHRISRGAASPAERALANRMLPQDRVCGDGADCTDQHTDPANTLSCSAANLHRSRGISR